MLLKKIKNSSSNFKSWFNKNSTAVEKKLKIFNLIQAPILTFSVLSFNFFLFKFLFVDSFMKKFFSHPILIFLGVFVLSLICLFSLFKTVKNNKNIENYFLLSIACCDLILINFSLFGDYPFLTKMSGFEIFFLFVFIFILIFYFLNFKIIKELKDSLKNKNINLKNQNYKNINNDELNNELAINLLNSEKLDKELEINGDNV